MMSDEEERRIVIRIKRDCINIQAVARHSEDFCGLKVDWQTQTLITAGATEALAATFLALVNPGDEVRHPSALFKQLSNSDQILHQQNAELLRLLHNMVAYRNKCALAAVVHDGLSKQSFSCFICTSNARIRLIMLKICGHIEGHHP